MAAAPPLKKAEMASGQQDHSQTQVVRDFVVITSGARGALQTCSAVWVLLRLPQSAAIVCLSTQCTRVTGPLWELPVVSSLPATQSWNKYIEFTVFLSLSSCASDTGMEYIHKTLTVFLFV